MSSTSSRFSLEGLEARQLLSASLFEPAATALFDAPAIVTPARNTIPSLLGIYSGNVMQGRTKIAVVTVNITTQRGLGVAGTATAASDTTDKFSVAGTIGANNAIHLTLTKTSGNGHLSWVAVDGTYVAARAGHIVINATVKWYVNRSTLGGTGTISLVR